MQKSFRKLGLEDPLSKEQRRAKNPKEQMFQIALHAWSLVMLTIGWQLRLVILNFKKAPWFYSIVASAPKTTLIQALSSPTHSIQSSKQKVESCFKSSRPRSNRAAYVDILRWVKLQLFAIAIKSTIRLTCIFIINQLIN